LLSKIKRGVNVSGEEQWITNKEYFEKTTADLYDKMGQLNESLQETQKIVAKYNGLHEKLGKLSLEIVDLDEKVDKQISRCDKVQSRTAGKTDAYSLLIKLWPILISTLIFILSMTNII
jgi:dsDNA-binding SOS-regulon protein